MGQVRKDSIINSIITYSGIGLGYLNKGLLFPLLLTPAQVGLANVILLIVNFFGQVSSLGMGTTVLRFFPVVRRKDRDNDSLLNFALGVSVIGILITTILLLIFQGHIVAYLSDRSPLLARYFFWTIPLGVVASLYIVLEPYYRSIGRPIIPVLLQDFVLRVLVLIVLLGYFFSYYSFDWFVVLFFLIHLIPGLYLLGFALISGWVRWQSAQKKLRRLMFYYGMYAYLNAIGRNIILMLDASMVTIMLDIGAAGVFTTMVFLANALFVPYVSLMRIVAPHVPRLWKEKNMTELKELYEKVTIIGFFVTFTFFAGTWFGMDFLLDFLPKEYAAGKYVFLFLMIGRLCDSVGGLNGDILLSSKKYRFEVWLTVPLIFATYFLNYLLIPEYGIVGAAIGTAFVYFTYNSVRLLVNYRYFNLHPFGKAFSVVVLVGFGMFGITSVIVYFIDSALWRLLIGGICVLVGFVFPIWRMKVLPNELTGFLDVIIGKLNATKRS